MREHELAVCSALLAGLGLVGAAAPIRAQQPQAVVDFRRQILPILQDSCLKCHREAHKDERGRTRKPKGGLRLDGRGWILAGGKNGAAVVPGKPERSPLYVRITLDPGDDDIMPAKGDPLTKAQAGLVRDWIVQGADFGDWVGKPGPGAGVVGQAQAAADVATLSTPALRVLADLGKGVKPAPPLVLRRAAKLCQIVPVVPGGPLLRVAFVSNEASVDDADVAELRPLAGHITELRLAKTRITDAALATVAGMARLTRLELNQTGITDAGLGRLTGLRELRHLNLHSTALTDAGIASLGQLPKLERVFLWNTKVTREGVQRLRQLLPQARISFELTLPRSEPAPGATSRRRRR